MPQVHLFWEPKNLNVFFTTPSSLIQTSMAPSARSSSVRVPARHVPTHCGQTYRRLRQGYFFMTMRVDFVSYCHLQGLLALMFAVGLRVGDVGRGR